MDCLPRGDSLAANTNAEVTRLTSEDLLLRATDMVPALKSRAAHTEELRRIPDETVQDLRAAGLNRIEVPNRFGGLDVSDGLVFQVGEELARGCASSSWCYSVWGANSYMAGFWPLEAQEELFANGPQAP